MHYTLPKNFILRGYQTFSDVIKNGQLLQSESLRCFYKTVRHGAQINESKNTPRLRIGFSVPKKNIPLAVHRNRIKRLLREAFRKNQELFVGVQSGDTNVNIVVIYRKNITKDRPAVQLHTIEIEWIYLAQILVKRIRDEQ